ncbi:MULTISPECIES: hypothetical protein [Rhodanobacter]|nr:MULTISPECIES: hypothetical protein [Rhodanobacter]
MSFPAAAPHRHDIAFDKRNRAAMLAVDLVESLFGKSTLIR